VARASSPDNALVICVDEKSQCQALKRTQPMLPMGFGYVEGVTHDYKRHGTTTLFAALNMLNGAVLAARKPRHRHQEFLSFLRETVAAVRPDTTTAVHRHCASFAAARLAVVAGDLGCAVAEFEPATETAQTLGDRNLIRNVRLTRGRL
jgi:hypothetical protein